jgi:PTS system N-acetylglucosamine-specific IIC component
VAAAPVADSQSGPLDPDPARWLAVFGGATNIVSLDAIASTRLRIVVSDPTALDRQRLAALDVAWISAVTFHVVVGEAASRYAQVLSARLPAAGATGGAASPQPA